MVFGILEIVKGEIMTAEQKWDSMSPEERICDTRLQYLVEEILESDWDKLETITQNHLIILLCERKKK
jgi:hypothetical protein